MAETCQDMYFVQNMVHILLYLTQKVCHLKNQFNQLHYNKFYATFG